MADDKNTKPPVTDPDDEENIVIDTTSPDALREAKIDEPDEIEAGRARRSGTFRGDTGTPMDEIPPS